MAGGINEWSDNEFRMFENLELPEEAFDDYFVQWAFDQALFSPDEDYLSHKEAMRYLRNRLEDDYGIDFDSIFDWDDYAHGGASNG